MGGGVQDGVSVLVGTAVSDGEGMDEGISVGGSGVDVAVAVGAGVSEVTGADSVAVGGGMVLVAVGSTAATSSCSCIPKATATRRVKAMSHAAINPLHSDPNPLPVPPGPLYGSLP